MKHVITGLGFILLATFLSSCNSEDDLPTAIKGIPVKIEVRHSPDDIFAEKDIETNHYIWKHKTYVRSIEGNIKIIEFGTYNFEDGKWVLGNFTKKPFKTERFELWYAREKEDGAYELCIDGILIQDIEYCDQANYSVNNANLVEYNGLWYYLGKDKDENLVCGYGRYHINPELKQDN